MVKLVTQWLLVLTAKCKLQTQTVNAKPKSNNYRSSAEC